MPQHLVFGKTGKLGARANDKFIHALFFESEFINYLILDSECSRAIKKFGGKGEWVTVVELVDGRIYTLPLILVGLVLSLINGS